MPPESPTNLQRLQLGKGVEFDPSSDELHRDGRVFKLERIPASVLLLLIERRGEVVRRDAIVEQVWGKDVFLDTDNSLNSAIRKIRQALKDDPDSPRFIQTISGKGYRFIAPVVSPTGDGPGETVPPSTSTIIRTKGDFVSELDGWLQTHRLRVMDEEHEPQNADHEPAHQGRRARTRLLLFAVASSVLACAALLALWVGRRPSSTPKSSTRKTILAVLPFENLSPDPDQEFFSDGLTEEMIAQVGKLNRDQLTVIARSSVARYKSSKLTAREIGNELNADYLVQGSVRRAPDRVRITVQLIQPQSQTIVWTESYDRELKDVLMVQASVVQSIANQIHIALTEEQRTRLANMAGTSPAAYVAYLKGRYYWNKRTGESIEKAEQYFQQAIDADPSYAAAYSGLADCNSGLAWHGFKAPAEALPKAYAAARKAAEIDPASAEAHASLGLVLSHRWDWSAAEAEFRRSLVLDPEYANAHHWYGDYLSMKGRHDEATAEAQRALELDPLNLMISTWVGRRYYFAHNYSVAIKQNRESVELDPNFAAAHLMLGEDYVQAGSYGQGVDELTKAASLSDRNPLYTAQLAVALASTGRKTEALHIAEQLESTRQRYVSPYGLAQIYAALGLKDDTFKWLQAAYHDRAVWMGYLAVDPVFDRYHSDPRFQDLLQHLDLL